MNKVKIGFPLLGLLLLLVLPGCTEVGPDEQSTEKPPITVKTDDGSEIVNSQKEISGLPFYIHVVAGEYYAPWINGLKEGDESVIALGDDKLEFHKATAAESRDIATSLIADPDPAYHNFIFWALSPADFQESPEGDMAGVQALTDEMISIVTPSGYYLIVGSAWPGLNNADGYQTYLQNKYKELNGKMFVFNFYRAFTKDSVLNTELFGEDGITYNEAGIEALNGEFFSYISALKQKLYK